MQVRKINGSSIGRCTDDLLQLVHAVCPYDNTFNLWKGEGEGQTGLHSGYTMT